MGICVIIVYQQSFACQQQTRNATAREREREKHAKIESHFIVPRPLAQKGIAFHVHSAHAINPSNCSI